MSLAWLISCATAGLASNVCGSVFGLLMIASACTYLPPICWITLAYSFSAPMAVKVVSDAAAAEPDVPPDEAGDEHALASRTAISGTAAARTPVRFRMTFCSRFWGSAGSGAES